MDAIHPVPPTTDVAEAATTYAEPYQLGRATTRAPLAREGWAMRPSGLTDVGRSCAACGQTFVFTAGEQELQALRGLAQPPRTCPPCRRTWRIAAPGRPESMP
jgi:hypothetical protein